MMVANSIRVNPRVAISASMHVDRAPWTTLCGGITERPSSRKCNGIAGD